MMVEYLRYRREMAVLDGHIGADRRVDHSNIRWKVLQRTINRLRQFGFSWKGVTAVRLNTKDWYVY
jgi:hypothetical protein